MTAQVGRWARAVGRGLARLALGLALALLVAFLVLGWQVNRTGAVDRAQPADAIVILGAHVNADGSPGSDLLSRTYRGMDLYNAGMAPVVICAGGIAGDRLSAGAVACRFAVEALGLPPERAWVAQALDALYTADEAVAVADLMRERGLRSVILVSHPLHLYRAAWLFRRQGLEVYTSPTNTELRRIAPPVRLWYTAREVGGVLMIALRGAPGVEPLHDWLRRRLYALTRWTG
ncbi:MAG: YdcF family protein [Caldilineales bacterium]|nr:YdcF family protein [Caldilineales bacterium]MDW8316244.1 YdcF family protein [Anaerolineae bacterium]